jgi:hypothetical protein
MHMFKVPIYKINIDAFFFSIFSDVVENVMANLLGKYGFTVFSGPNEMYSNF